MERLLYDKLLNIHKAGINNTPAYELSQIKEDFKKFLDIEFEVMEFTFSPRGACSPSNRFNLYFYENTEDNNCLRYYLSDDYKIEFIHNVRF